MKWKWQAICKTITSEDCSLGPSPPRTVEYPEPLKSESELESSGFGVLVALLIAVEERLEEGTCIQAHSSGLTVQPGAEDMTVEPALAVKAKDCSLPSWWVRRQRKGNPVLNRLPHFLFLFSLDPSLWLDAMDSGWVFPCRPVFLGNTLTGMPGGALDECPRHLLIQSS